MEDRTMNRKFVFQIGLTLIVLSTKEATFIHKNCIRVEADILLVDLKYNVPWRFQKSLRHYRT